jgi:hypothetical protein
MQQSESKFHSAVAPEMWWFEETSDPSPPRHSVRRELNSFSSGRLGRTDKWRCLVEKFMTPSSFQMARPTATINE